MGKTKTAFVTGTAEEKITGKAAYEEKKRKQEQERKKHEEEAKKKAVKGVGLKGGERVKTVEAGPIIKEEKSASVESDSTAARQGQPKTRGKKYKSARAKIDKNKLYKIAEAVDLIKETSYSSFNGSVEMHLVVKKDLSVKVGLPYSSGSSKKIEIANDKTIKKLKEGKIDFDILLSTPDMMPKLVSFAKILGPKGLMPNPKAGTIIKDKKEAKKFSGNSITIKTEKKQPVIHTVVGKVDQMKIELEANIEAIIDAIGNKQIVKAYIKATMSPSIKLEVKA